MQIKSGAPIGIFCYCCSKNALICYQSTRERTTIMNKKSLLLIFAITLTMLPLLAVTADAFPNKTSFCTNCHDQDSNVVVTATFQDCSSGSIANYEVTVSPTYSGPEGWAVYDSSNTNIANNYGSPGSFSVAADQTYKVYGVSFGSGMGGADNVTITPECGSPCTDADDDNYALEGGDCGPIDCDDDNPGIHPGAPEICTDGLDNDCNGLVDAQDGKAVNCPSQCTDGDGDGYAVEGGACGPLDCDDTYILSNPGASEICNDGYDNDCDGLLDGADTDCGGCVQTGREKGKKCSDGIDNDCDDLTDGDDPDCGSKHSKSPAEICDDGIDNDGDNKIDCSDKKDCGKVPACRN
jgi:hypothetical protein